jgi:hypothetical protein
LSDAQALCTIVRMTAGTFINCRVSTETKARIRGLADSEGVSESALVKRLLFGAIRNSTAMDEPAPPVDRELRGRRISVCLTSGDRRLLQERAELRGQASATYVAFLIRSHLSGGAPLPKTEYLALREAILQLTAMGRNLNQLARIANQGGNPKLPGPSEVVAMLKIAEALRDHVRELLKANEASWTLRRNGAR